MIFGAITFVCLLVAMTLSVHGHHPALMVPIAIACAVVFVRHGDGREHSLVLSPADELPPATTSGASSPGD